MPRVTLEQWKVLQAVVDEGGFAQAADKLHRSQSSVSYTLSKLQEQLGVPLLVQEGRKAKLTDIGELLLNRSMSLIRDAQEIEDLAHSLQAGYEAEVKLVVDQAFPYDLLVSTLKEFQPLSKGTRVLLEEEVLSGSEEALQNKKADLVICGAVPNEFIGEHLLDVEFWPVAHPKHILFQKKRLLTNDLEQDLQIVLRDSGQKVKRDVGWLACHNQWRVSSFEAAIAILRQGIGFCWLPKHRVLPHIEAGGLKLLPLPNKGKYRASLYLVMASSQPGPASRLLAGILRDYSEQFVAKQSS